MYHIISSKASGKGLPFAVAGVVLSIAGIFLWQSLALVWSFFFIFMPLAGLTAIFIFNPGSTPATTGSEKWVKSYAFDLVDAVKRVSRDVFKSPYFIVGALIVAAATAFTNIAVGFAVFFGLFLISKKFRNAVNLLATATVSMTTLGVLGVITPVIIDIPVRIGSKIRSIYKNDINKVISNIGMYAGITASIFAIVKYAFPVLLTVMPVWLVIPIAVAGVVFAISFFKSLFAREIDSANMQLGVRGSTRPIITKFRNIRLKRTAI